MKIYSKTLDLIQSASVAMPLKINTKELFNPSNWMSKELRESKDQGLLRIEISYIADDELAEQMFFKIDFEA